MVYWITSGVLYCAQRNTKQTIDVRIQKDRDRNNVGKKLSYRETAHRLEVSSHHRVREWERICLTEGPAGLVVRKSPLRVSGGGGLFGSFPCALLLPLALVGLPPRRERRVFWGEGGGDVVHKTSCIILVCIERMDKVDFCALPQVEQLKQSFLIL